MTSVLDREAKKEKEGQEKEEKGQGSGRDRRREGGARETHGEGGSSTLGQASARRIPGQPCPQPAASPAARAGRLGLRRREPALPSRQPGQTAVSGIVTTQR